ncbi:MAG TPA: branched-chain amino acid ABC transporter permease [Terrimesophilobacter sp.]|nr:branched-chain amino acid ABC transporter permease [Terrimesophilobacter sp.]
MILLGALLAALTLSTLLAPPASADEVNVDKYDYIFSGNVKYNDKPLDGVVLEVSGNGYDEEVKTDAKGQWKVGVPKKDKYDITLVESTLPKGVIVSEEANDRVSISDKGATIEAEFGLTNNKSVNFFLGEGVRQVTSFTDQLIARTISGLNFGLMLALASIGLSLIYGTTGLANFAHAEFVTFGAVMALTFSVDLAFPIWIAFPIAVVLSGALGWVLDIGLWKPLRKRSLSVVQLMIVSIGLSLALRYTFQYFYGGGTRQLPDTGSAKIQLLGPIALSRTDMVSMAISIVVLVAVAYWLLRTRTGKATRAISDNPSLAAASGIDVDRVIRLLWILGAALAGLSGILWAYFRPGIKWDMGWQILLLIFAAIVLGGLGTAFGALVGSIIVGLLVEVSTLWVPSDLKYVGALTILIVVLLFRPQGLLGRKERIG